MLSLDSSGNWVDAYQAMRSLPPGIYDPHGPVAWCRFRAAIVSGVLRTRLEGVEVEGVTVFASDRWRQTDPQSLRNSMQVFATDLATYIRTGPREATSEKRYFFARAEEDV